MIEYSLRKFIPMPRKRNKIVAFLDTNIFLHFKRIDQIDWGKTLSAKTIELKIAPIILRELTDKQIGDSLKNRSRAEKTLKYFDKIFGKSGACEIRPGVSITFLDSEPSAKYFDENYKLSKQLNDDWLLASILEFKETCKEKIGLVTNDFALRPKARRLGIEVFQPTDSDILPDEKNSKELELARIKLNLPKIKVTHLNGKMVAKLSILTETIRDECVKCERFYEPGEFSSQGAKDCAHVERYYSEFSFVINNIGNKALNNLYIFTHIPRLPDYYYLRFNTDWSLPKYPHDDKEISHFRYFQNKEHYTLFYHFNILNPDMRLKTPNIKFYFKNCINITIINVKFELKAIELVKAKCGELKIKFEKLD
jgi:rRNA-processing protein FCF1